jgi:hypothetical protein
MDTLVVKTVRMPLVEVALGDWYATARTILELDTGISTCLVRTDQLFTVPYIPRNNKMGILKRQGDESSTTRRVESIVICD